MSAEAGETRKVTPLKGVLYLAVIGALGAGAAAFGLSQRTDAGAVVATAAPEPIPVRVQVLVAKDRLDLDEAFTGLAEARRSSALGFERGGALVDVTVDEGDRVKKGDVLARLDTRALQAQLAAYEAQASEARAMRDLALATRDRLATLADKNLTPTQRLDEADASLKQATARIAAAEAGAESVRVQIALSRIAAPFDGVITGRFMDEGAIAGPGAPVLRLVEDGAVELKFGLPVGAAATLDPETAYTVTGEAGQFMATLKAQTGVVDPAQRTVNVVFEAEEGARVRAGSIVRLSLGRTIEERGYWVPVTALSEGARGLWSLYVVEPAEGGGLTIAPRPVEIVYTDGNRAYVRGPLSEGEQAVAEGIARLVPGMPVSVATQVAGQDQGQRQGQRQGKGE